jgi:DNA polymerase I-like protein with 3'-5' exonuclease and polymerase domains
MSIGPDRRIPQGVFREGANHPIQGAVADLKNITMLELLERCEWLTLAKEQHDAFWLECPVECEAETWPVYQEVVQRERVIEGVRMAFPAEFKRYLADGRWRR